MPWDISVLLTAGSVSCRSAGRRRPPRANLVGRSDHGARAERWSYQAERARIDLDGRRSCLPNKADVERARRDSPR
jgi:hypothetical protein